MRVLVFVKAIEGGDKIGEPTPEALEAFAAKVIADYGRVNVLVMMDSFGVVPIVGDGWLVQNVYSYG